MISCQDKSGLPKADLDNGGLFLPDGFEALVVIDSAGKTRHIAVNDIGDIYAKLRTSNDGNGGTLAMRDLDGDGRMDSMVRFGDYEDIGQSAVSNYSDGKVSVLPVQGDGRLGPLVQLIQHEGSGPNPDRQQGPHVHSAFFSPDEKQVYVQDLGTDKVNIYDFHPEDQNNPLRPAAQPFVKSSPGGGPRHAAVSTDGQYLYLLEEMAAKVMVFAKKGGQLEPVQEISVNEDGYKGSNGAAEIKLSPDGKFLYASNRGDAHTLAIYRVNTADGTLTKVGNQSTLGERPRNFTISPDGRYLLAANQDSDNVVIFARDLDTGLLTDTGHRINVGAPVCLVF